MNVGIFFPSFFTSNFGSMRESSSLCHSGQLIVSFILLQSSAVMRWSFQLWEGLGSFIRGKLFLLFPPPFFAPVYVERSAGVFNWMEKKTDQSLKSFTPPSPALPAHEIFFRWTMNRSHFSYRFIDKHTHKGLQFAKVACLESFFTWVPRPSGSKFRLIILQFNSFLFFATFVQPFFGKVKGAVCGLLKKTFNKQKRQQLTPSSFSSWFLPILSLCLCLFYNSSRRQT